MGRTTTPYSAAFFAMVSIGGVLGAAVPFILMIVDGLTTASFDPFRVTHSVFGFFMGLVLGGSGAGPAIGLHTWAARKAPRLRVPAAVLGGVLGPVVLAAVVVGWPWLFPAMSAIWMFILAASATTAVWVTQPLRAPAETVPSARKQR